MSTEPKLTSSGLYVCEIGQAGLKICCWGRRTPIQTEVYELWDLLNILNAGADFVVGREPGSRWADWNKALPMVKGEERPADVSGMRGSRLRKPSWDQ